MKKKLNATAALYAAVRRGDEAGVSSALSAGADPDPKCTDTIVTASIENDTEVDVEGTHTNSITNGNTVDDEGDWYPTALYEAVGLDRLGICKLLIAAGADPAKRGGNYGETSFHAAAAIPNAAVLKYLLSTVQIPPSSEAERANSTDTFTSAHQCDGTRSVAAALRLSMIDKGDDENYTPLHDAITRRCSECAVVLVEAGASLRKESIKGSNAVNYAVSYSDTRTLGAILQRVSRPQEVTSSRPTLGDG